MELTDAALQQHARRLGIMAVPSLSGPHDELRQRLSGGCRGDAPTSAGRHQRASTEGWVLMTAEGERRKLVQVKPTRTLANRASFTASIE
jgi:hypothetical protein